MINAIIAAIALPGFHMITRIAMTAEIDFIVLVINAITGKWFLYDHLCDNRRS